jgi:hypothetical protein
MDVSAKQLIMSSNSVNSRPGQLALVQAQVLNSAGLPVPGAPVYFDVRGTALQSEESVVTFTIPTDTTGKAALRYGQRSADSGAIVESEDVVVARALSLSGDGLSATWLTGVSVVNFIDPVDDVCNTANCNAIGLPYMECEVLCDPPNVCNINCEVPPDPCVVAGTACETEMPDYDCIDLTTTCSTHSHINYPGTAPTSVDSRG